ncbi:MoaD/ThiS family protein [Tetragenococcus halophilus]|uniref:MoaD/ThiS family protein n=1 Tax=Tetragenococcus halophilus TaxID=51669 RepID=UPI00209AD557|nr:MoaD/ThiS family protein [Tetragenococcus halophilus]MCO8287370.1 MoaD/ThiS family protein [Tetragenococcus halophilus]
MQAKIKAFAYLGEKLNHEVIVDLPLKVTKITVLEAIKQQFPQYKAEITECSVAINQSFIGKESYVMSDIAEIALIPPVSGG